MLALTRPEKKIIVAVLSILMALCTLAYLAYRNSQRFLDSAEAIELAEEFKYHILEVRAIAMEMETGVRGYVMTGDSSFLTPANEAITDIFLHLRQLENTPGKTTIQTNQIGQLHSLVDEKSTYILRTAEVRRQQGMEAAVAFIRHSRERELMTQIRDITGSMLSDAEANLALLKDSNRSKIMHFAVTFYLLLFKLSITVVTIVFLFVFYFRRRNKSEKALKDTQSLFQNVLDHTTSVISIKDLSGRYLLINKAYEKLLNTSKERVVGKTIYDLFDKSYAESIRNNDLEVIRLQQQIKREESIHDGTGMRHFSSVKFPLFDSEGLPYAICSISTDDTETLEVDKIHQEQMNRILDLFNNAPCGYQATNREGIIIEMNETLLRWLGYTRDEVVGKLSVRDLISEESMDQYAYYFPRIRSGEIKSIFDVKGTYVRKDKSRFAIVANTIALYDENGEFEYTRTSIFDASFRTRPEGIITKN